MKDMKKIKQYRLSLCALFIAVVGMFFLAVPIIQLSHLYFTVMDSFASSVLCR